jgi:hypothetical protein
MKQRFKDAATIYIASCLHISLGDDNESRKRKEQYPCKVNRSDTPKTIWAGTFAKLALGSELCANYYRDSAFAPDPAGELRD